jgi:23S rRNA (guanosine2251-2'-O)-methyltransferase
MPVNRGYSQKKDFFSRVLTVYGRKPALEALQDPRLTCHALHLADSNRDSGIISQLKALATARDIPIRVHSRIELSRISRNGKQDQGVAVDIICPAFRPVEEHLHALPGMAPQRLMALDGITNPQNLGMIVRSASAGQIDGIIWSRRGNAALGPLVIKASAGTLYRAPLLICPDLPQTLQNYRERGVEICALSAGAALSLFEHRPAGHCIYILGNETAGVSATARETAATELSIPMGNGVESLNVAVTASLIAYANSLRDYLDR